MGKALSRRTGWRMRAHDALKPWRYRYGIFPRDPPFAEKAAPILDLYAGQWQAQPLSATDYLLSADEKTRLQARRRGHPSLAPAPGQAARLEHESERGGALHYLAAWEVRRGLVIGRCEPHTGIRPFTRRVRQVVAQAPYCSAQRLFWVVDNGSSPRGERSATRRRQIEARNIVVYTPVPASWRNQIEIYFSIMQRKVLTPNDFPDLNAVRLRLARYEELSNGNPQPFPWKFNQDDLAILLEKIEARERLLQSLQRQGHIDVV